MILPIGLDRVPEAVGIFLARRCHWSPIGRQVSIHIEDSADVQLIGKRLTGTVCACGAADSGAPLLVYLSESIRYEGHYTTPALDLLVATPVVRWHGPSRLLLTWSAVRLVDAPSFADQEYDRTIGTARLLLC